MGSFKYIVSGNKDACLTFMDFDKSNCYSISIDKQEGTDEAYRVWISGERKFMPSSSDLEDQSKKLSVEVKGSYEYEDPDEDDPAGFYVHFINGEDGDEEFDDDENLYLDIDQYSW